VRQTPTVEEELILLLCGTTERRAQAAPALAALTERVDYELLAALMSRQLLLPLLGTRLLALTPTPVPPAFATRHAAALDAARWRGLALEALDRRVRGDLGEAGIEALPLKGATLSRELYGQPGIRQSTDVDVLVEPDQLAPAAAALRRRGYRPAAGSEPRRRLHLDLEHELGKLPPVELHWRVHWYEEAFSRRMLRRSEPSEDGLRAQPADELASLLLFFSRDGLTGLRLATDAAAWWDLHGRTGEPALLDRVAAEAPQLRGALSAAAIALERLVGVPSASLLSRPARSRRTMTATRLANWTVTGELDQVSANVTLVDWLLAPPGGGRAFARRTLLPPARRIDAMYGLTADAAGRRAFWRLAHVPKLLLRYAIALWRLRGGRSWMPIPAAAEADSIG
jgi:Uncharacterised nucleotidyltransferase